MKNLSLYFHLHNHESNLQCHVDSFLKTVVFIYLFTSSRCWALLDMATQASEYLSLNQGYYHCDETPQSKPWEKRVYLSYTSASQFIVEGSRYKN